MISIPTRAALATALVLTFARGADAEAERHEHGAAAGNFGTVAFATSCNAAAQSRFDHAVAVLHSFEFQRAIDGFNTVLAADPACAIAEWGIALSRWSNPFATGIRRPALLQQGRDAVERAKAIGPKTERERAYVDAVARLYADFETTDQGTRVRAYRDAMSKVAAAHPDDVEASTFYALALAAAASPADKTFADLVKAGSILEALVVRRPDHPGLAHYIIHAYDVPPLADRALAAARSYAKIAPSAPHALHMPSHTFTRLGYWQESIDTNIASGTIAKRDGSVAEELHAMDYRTYAYLQTAQDDAARAMLDALPGVAARFDPDAVGSAAPGSAGIFALAAIPARYALERGAWAEAAALKPQPSKFPYTEALTHFARALGAARTGDAASVRASIAALETIREQLARANEGYWAEQTEIQRRAASAWLAFAERREADALAEMRAAATLEDGTEKAAVTPGPLVPARELLGEMLLELKDPAQARQEFEATLEKEPNRFRATFGAARAASLMGDGAAARRYYDRLLAVCERADKPGRPELAEARQARAASR